MEMNNKMFENRREDKEKIRKFIKKTKRDKKMIKKCKRGQKEN